MGREWELKFAAKDPSVLEDILTCLQKPCRQMHMESTYYDTRDGDLAARKWTLRRRQEGETSVITMKTDGDGHQRGEWEYTADSVAGAGRLLPQLGAPPQLQELLKDGVVPVCGAVFTRRSVLLELDGAAAELALDHGILFREDRRLPLCEVELELKQGNEAAVETFGRELAQRFCLTEEPRSKFVRAVSL